MVLSFSLSNALRKTSVANQNMINILEESQVQSKSRTTEERKVKNYSTPHPPQLQRERERERGRHLGGTSFDLIRFLIFQLFHSKAVWLCAVGCGVALLCRLCPAALRCCVLCAVCCVLSAVLAGRPTSSVTASVILHFCGVKFEIFPFMYVPTDGFFRIFETDTSDKKMT